jgi:uncharacterized membrane protein YeaQ/YmgE (transglycosylase-associated protein family)
VTVAVRFPLMSQLRGPWPTLCCSKQPREALMHIISMVIVGLIVGALAKLFMPGRDPGGFVVTIVLGIAGSLFAGWLGHAVGWYRNSEQGPGIIASIIGAMLILGIYRLVIRRRRIV